MSAALAALQLYARYVAFRNGTYFVAFNISMLKMKLVALAPIATIIFAAGFYWQFRRLSRRMPGSHETNPPRTP